MLLVEDAAGEVEWFELNRDVEDLGHRLKTSDAVGHNLGADPIAGHNSDF